MKKSKHIVYPPEYYLEIPEKDVRLAVKACNGFMNTIKMAEFSLRSVKILADEELDNIVINIAHLRHAIEDLNNSFDLLLQIPWMHYRIWEAFNHSGCLRKGRLKNKCEIERNSDCWVLKAEENCNEKKVIAFMKVHYRNRCDMIKGFYNHYINNHRKPFTVRTLCNTLKHKHDLEFYELYEAYKLPHIKAHREILESSDSTKIGSVFYTFDEDLTIDIKYDNGEVFYYNDISNPNRYLKIPDVLNECVDYHDALIDLFDEIYMEVKKDFQMLPEFIGEDGQPNVKSTRMIALSDNLMRA